jgi:hypothetical protein
MPNSRRNQSQKITRLIVFRLAQAVIERQKIYLAKLEAREAAATKQTRKKSAKKS